MRGIRDRARQLRRDATEAERQLWKRLRNRQIAGAKFRRQVPIDPYIVDFICFETRLVVEVDGGQHARSGVDAARTAFLESHGFRVVRVWNHEVLGNIEGVLSTIEDALVGGSS
ncbi:MAG: endonuclease domain-containing protein [Alphaproteobacteria bacterium]